MPTTSEGPSLPAVVIRLIIFLFSCLSVTLLPAKAQQGPLDAPAFSISAKDLLSIAAQTPKDKSADSVVLSEEDRYVIDEQGRETVTSHVICRVDTEKGVERWASVSMEYSPWRQNRPKIRARIVTSDGLQHDLDTKTLSDIAIRENDPDVYGDKRSYEGPLPALAPGSVLEEEIVLEDKLAFLEGVWSLKYRFGESDPVLRTKLVVDAPQSLNLRYITRELPNLEMGKTEANGRVQYVFQAGRLEATEPQPLLPPEAPRSGYVELSTASSWGTLAKEYSKKVEPQISPDEVKSLLAVTGSQSEQISKMLEKLHSQVRYTGLEFGESSLVPQSPAEILKRKYGDCKDKAALFVSMLRGAGINANLALLNAGAGQDVDPEVPAINRFNHAIVYIPSKDLFIDATAEYMRVGELPSGDQNRWALIVSENTTELKRVPQLPSSANKWLEEREFYLSEYGPARVVETTLWTGDLESYYRSSFAGKENKDLKKNLDGYAKSMYLAEGVSKYDYSNPADLGTQFNLRLDISKAKRGTTELTDGVAAIRLADMVSERIPSELKKEPDKDSEPTGATTTTKNGARTLDWYLDETSQTEWRYHIIPSQGFRVRKLPENSSIVLGPATLKQEYKALPDGSVQGTIVFDLVKRRYTVREVTDLQEGLRQLQDKGVLFIHFDLAAYTLLQQGKPREALAEYRKLITAHPKEGVHRAQLAQAYLMLGLGESARIQAQEAVKLDPSSPIAYATQGWILQHDLFGRRFTKGFDPAGAAAAYRTAHELDSKEVDYAISLGESLEFDNNAERYSEHANLPGAIDVYQALRKDHDADQSTVNEHLVYALAYAGHYTELRDLLTQLGDQPLYNSMRVLVTGATEGGEAAVRKSAEITSDEKARSNVLAAAGTLAMRMRLYPAAAEMLSIAAPGQSNASAMSNLAQTLRRTQRCETLTVNDADAAGLVSHTLRASADPARRQELLNLLSRASRELPSGSADEIVKQHWNLRFNAGLPEKVMVDIVLSSVKIAAEGDASAGYRVALQFPGAKTEHVFVVKEDGTLKILSESDQLAPLGQEVLDRINRNDLAGAKVLLDWAREERKLVGGEDPYAGPMFTRMWSRGQDVDPVAMKLAGISLLLGIRGTADVHVGELESALKNARTDSEKARVEELLLHAYLLVKRWTEAETLARTLMSQSESSVIFRGLITSLEREKKWSAIEEAVQQQKDKLPDNFTALEMLGHSYIAQGQPEKAMQVFKGIIDSGKGETSTINEYGWSGVVMGKVPSEAIETVQSTVQQQKNQNYAILHTLGCMLAVVNRGPEAQQVLLEAMKYDKTVDGPNSTIWFGFGLLAESYGETEAAAQLYKKVDKPNNAEPSPESTYDLAQQRLISLDHTKIRAAVQ